METQYIKLLCKCLQSKTRTTRNATVYSVFGERLEHDFINGFPLLTTKKMFFKGIVEELAWFLRGSTNVSELKAKGVHIWDKNTEGRNNDAGPVYGFQWRHFGARYQDNLTKYGGVDQIQRIIDLIKTEPTSRRIFMSAWNPSQQDEMCLPPCHISYQFYVHEGRLSCQMYQRSADIFLGLPFNIASTALLLQLIAHECDLSPGKMILCLGDVHLYHSHIRPALKQIIRKPLPFPFIQLTRDKDGLKKVELKEIALLNYESYSALKADMIA